MSLRSEEKNDANLHKHLKQYILPTLWIIELWIPWRKAPKIMQRWAPQKHNVPSTHAECRLEKDSQKVLD